MNVLSGRGSGDEEAMMDETERPLFFSELSVSAASLMKLKATQRLVKGGWAKRRGSSESVLSVPISGFLTHSISSSSTMHQTEGWGLLLLQQPRQMERDSMEVLTAAAERIRDIARSSLVFVRRG
jgi:hypothetical protein